MSASQNDNTDERSQADQLIDLLVYAPVGLLYEYGEVLPQLVKRGKSQVQLAKVMGQMAAKQGQKSVDGAILEAAGTLAKGITEFGSLLGLAPDTSTSTASPAPDPIDVEEVKPANEASADPKKKKDKAKKSSKASKSDEPVRLPIARYDDLTAKEIVPLLGDLTTKQRARVRTYEAANRNRKTILAKLDRLD